MTKYLLLLAIISMAVIPSCTSLDRKTPIHKNIDQDLVPYTEEFLSKASARQLMAWRSYKLSMGFKKLPGKIIGVCYGWSNNYREISFDPKRWAKYSEIERKALTFHELIHCLCNRDHDFDKGKYPEKEYFWTPREGYFLDGCSTSIMHPTLQDEECLEKHWDHYEQEMWDRCKP